MYNVMLILDKMKCLKQKVTGQLVSERNERAPSSTRFVCLGGEFLKM